MLIFEDLEISSSSIEGFWKVWRYQKFSKYLSENFKWLFWKINFKRSLKRFQSILKKWETECRFFKEPTRIRNSFKNFQMFWGNNKILSRLLDKFQVFFCFAKLINNENWKISLGIYKYFWKFLGKSCLAMICLIIIKCEYVPCIDIFLNRSSQTHKVYLQLINKKESFCYLIHTCIWRDIGIRKKSFHFINFYYWSFLHQ